MPMFAFPIAFVGLASLAGLVAIYWLRNRSRRHTVSSLILWMDHRRARQGGRVFQRIQTPLLFFLELLLLLLLVLAAAGPLIRGQAARRLVVVLDNSYSMSAGADKSAHKAAQEGVLKAFSEKHSVVQFILAGKVPQVLGKPVETASQARDLLKQWTCQAPNANISEAIALANQLAGRQGRILVVTDHAPKNDPGDKRLVWQSFGSPVNNVAIVTAQRNDRSGRQRVMLEIANFSDSPARTMLTVNGVNFEWNRRKLLQLKAQSTERLFFDLPAGSGSIEAAIDADVLPMDDRVVLLPQRSPKVRYQCSLSDPQLQRAFEEAMQATGFGLPSTTTPELLITDQASAGITQYTWRLLIHDKSDNKTTSAYTGPFVLDRSHMLTEGLDLQGVIWAADSTRSLTGVPLLMAGNVPLITDNERFGNSHDIQMQLIPQMSTLLQSPNWPIFVYNILRWRDSAKPGLRQANVRLGWAMELMLGDDYEKARHITPDGLSRVISLRRGRQRIVASQTGLHRIVCGEKEYRFSCGALNPQESDLSAARPGRWGTWDEAGTFGHEYRSIAFVPAVVALAILLLHMMLAARTSGGFKE